MPDFFKKNFTRIALAFFCLGGVGLIGNIYVLTKALLFYRGSPVSMRILYSVFVWIRPFFFPEKMLTMACYVILIVYLCGYAFLCFLLLSMFLLH